MSLSIEVLLKMTNRMNNKMTTSLPRLIRGRMSMNLAKYTPLYETSEILSRANGKHIIEGYPRGLGMNLAEKIDAKLEKWRSKPRSKSILEAWGRLYDGPAGFILFQIVAIPVIVCFSVVEKLGNYWWSYVLAGVIAMAALAIALSIWSRVTRKGTPAPEEEE